MSHCQGCANWEKSFQEQGAAGLKMGEMIRDLKARNAALEDDREAFAREVLNVYEHPNNPPHEWTSETSKVWLAEVRAAQARAIAAVKAARGEK